eukprot:TRINITY_DN12303_c0_g1_i1.p1 TRINITY_DN12303_c0_g1~~TRINITY_DN12303_c0_g1_i1.p1  ORF type:complete len:123 (+),score=6.08 TRINITY_DN12303_c0_g1_i1:46-369(+)
MNYLLQASYIVPDLAASRHYIRTARTIGSRLVVRHSANVKRSHCKRCLTISIAEGTEITRFKGTSNSLVRTCKLCGLQRRFPLHKQQRQTDTTMEDVVVGGKSNSDM